MSIVPDGMPTVALAFNASQTQAGIAVPANAPGTHLLNTRLAHWTVQQHALDQLRRHSTLASGGER